MKPKRNSIVLALGMGIAIPFLYFGIQVAAAPFFPGYSFAARDASTLGSAGSSLQSVFNLGCLVVGLVTLVASWGFLRAFQVLGVRAIIA